MEYKDFFSPNTLAKLNKQSAENLRQMLGDKTLMQTMMSSQQLLGQIAKAEAPYKDKLEKLAINIVKELYPIIDEEGITIDAKIVSMDDINNSLDEIKVNKPTLTKILFDFEKEYIHALDDKEDIEDALNELIKKYYKKYPQFTKEINKWVEDYNKQYLDEIKINKPVDYQKIWDETYQEAINKITREGVPNINDWDRNLLDIRKKLYKNKTGKDWDGLDEVKINKPGYENLYSILTSSKNLENTLGSIGYSYGTFGDLKGYAEELSEEYNIPYNNVFKVLEKIEKQYEDKIEEWTDEDELLNESISPESRRRIINSITQGAAVRGSFAFYLFKEHLDEIDPSLIDKYNEIMKNTFGIYDDENAIAMFLSLLAQGHKAAGGSSKVIMNEVKINKPKPLNFYYEKSNELFPNEYYGYLKGGIINNKYGISAFYYPSENAFKVYEPNRFNNDAIDYLSKFGELKKGVLIIPSDKVNIANEPINEQQENSKITIQARAINFPMLVHEIVKGLFELISLQGFKGSKEQNQQVADRVDVLKNEPYDLRYGKFIYDALRNIAINNNAEPRTIPYFFAEVYKMDNEEFIEFIENSILGKLTSEQERWAKITIREIEDDLKADSTGLDEIKIKNPIEEPSIEEQSKMITHPIIIQAWVDYYNGGIDNKALINIIKKTCINFDPAFYEWIGDIPPKENSLPPTSSGSYLTAFYNNDYEDIEDEELWEKIRNNENSAYTTVLDKIQNNLDEVKIQLNDWKLILKNIIKDDKLENLSNSETAEYDVNSKNKPLYNFLITNQYDSYNPYIFEGKYLVYWAESENKIIIETIYEIN